jgi:hypothetical protein
VQADIDTVKVVVKNVPDYAAGKEKNDLGFLTFDLQVGYYRNLVLFSFWASRIRISLYGSGSGSFQQQAKKINLDFKIQFFNDFLMACYLIED